VQSIPAISVRTVQVISKNIPITESAVGSETTVGNSANGIRIRLPFPIHVARQLKKGMSIELTNFTDKRKTRGYIAAIHPALNATTQSMEVIAIVPKPGSWRATGSVRGEVTLGVHRNALIVPEMAVVSRPAGNVVYLVEGKKAKEQKVTLGIERFGEIEILSGLKKSQTVVSDGAASLSDGANITIQR